MRLGFARHPVATEGPQWLNEALDGAMHEPISVCANDWWNGDAANCFSSARCLFQTLDLVCY